MRANIPDARDVPLGDDPRSAAGCTYSEIEYVYGKQAEVFDFLKGLLERKYKRANATRI